ncbi:helix-turn-helix domain-containing protein [Rhizobium sp.]|uniref:helix-turn-helix domain-containing protein n=1 Tax=Rhizobium sp. TaxID=391 RepID=UPI003F7DAA82
MMLQAKTYSSGAEMLGSYAAIRQRLQGAPERAPVVTKPYPELKPIKATQRLPMWRWYDMPFDAHVLAYREWQITNGFKMKHYLAKRAHDLGFTIEDMRGSGRKADVVSVRQMLMWEIRTKFGKSCPEIGRLFNKDHTSIICACRKYEAAKIKAVGA